MDAASVRVNEFSERDIDLGGDEEESNALNKNLWDTE